MASELVALPKELAPEPADGTGALVGYARIPASGEIRDRRVRALRDAGCVQVHADTVYADTVSGANADQPELRACLEGLRPGDTLVVPSLDGLSRSLPELITTVAGLHRRGAGFRSLHEALDTTTPGGRLVFHVFAALAEYMRELIVTGTQEGLSAARARGVRLGRPPAMDGGQIRHARELLARPENTVSSIARLLGISRSTLYKYVPEIASGGLEARPAAAVRTRQESRPGRKVLVATSLADLRGPAGGTIELPLRLFWYPDRTFDLDEPGMLPWLYQIVLREASRPDDLTTYLNGETLVAVWPRLYLPKGVREAWEDQHPPLRAARAGAAAA